MVGGTTVTVGAQTRLPTLRKALGIAHETTAFYRTNDVIRILDDSEPVATQVPDGAVIEFRSGPIGPETDLDSDDRGGSDGDCETRNDGENDGDTEQD
ncbi:hypothetical protein C491_17649 [Natronococcus amylolyticus DSM 10524]|uniref:Uncharacterized protein n=1 Tax=Natronococcus amylolyticus DSM 10524 TaxID=1227497 RepID=L9WZQ8_9EURY|nr:hypothetical protein C491_17649 [Natronococcus amylolyticus DSM 10524]